MIVAEEITDWDYNHTYLLSKCKTKAHGYWKHHKEWIPFSNPMKFDKRKRKFKYQSLEMWGKLKKFDRKC